VGHVYGIWQVTLCGQLLTFNSLGAADVMFSYEIEFRWSEVRWASRWNVYLEMSDLNIHWFSIINSVIVVFFLAGLYCVVTVVLLLPAEATAVLFSALSKLCQHDNS